MLQVFPPSLVVRVMGRWGLSPSEPRTTPWRLSVRRTRNSGPQPLLWECQVLPAALRRGSQNGLWGSNGPPFPSHFEGRTRETLVWAERMAKRVDERCERGHAPSGAHGLASSGRYRWLAFHGGSTEVSSDRAHDADVRSSGCLAAQRKRRSWFGQAFIAASHSRSPLLV